MGSSVPLSRLRVEPEEAPHPVGRGSGCPEVRIVDMFSEMIHFLTPGPFIKLFFFWLC